MVGKGKPSALGGDGLPMGSKYNQMNQPKNKDYQPVRNEATNINGLDYSAHAVDRMQDRGIPPSVVENTIKYGVSKPNGGGKTSYYDSGNNVSVIVNNKGSVVTVQYGKAR
jgi:filamentous hemagglutinin